MASLNELTMVIPSRDLHGMLRACVTAAQCAAVQAGLRDTAEIVIIDNASRTPYTRDDFPGTWIIRFDQHQHFATCCNAGWRAGSGRRVLFLNNDVLLSTLAIEGMIDALAAHGPGIAGTLLEFPNGTIQHAGVGFPSRTPINMGRDHSSRESLGEATFPPAVTGAALMADREVLHHLGGWDERYAFGHEDVDLCLRARQAGYTIVLDRRSRSLHFESMTPGRSQYEEESRMTFYARWDGRLSLDGNTR